MSEMNSTILLFTLFKVLLILVSLYTVQQGCGMKYGKNKNKIYYIFMNKFCFNNSNRGKGAKVVSILKFIISLLSGENEIEAIVYNYLELRFVVKHPLVDFHLNENKEICFILLSLMFGEDNMYNKILN